jgi:hypothetical protein
MQPARSSVGRILYGASATHLHLRFGDAPPSDGKVDVEVTGGMRVEVPPGRWSIAVPLGEPHAPGFAVRLSEPGRGVERIPVAGTITVRRLGAPSLAVVAAECAPVAVAGELARSVRATVDAILGSGRHCVVVLPHHRGLGSAAPGVRLEALDVATTDTTPPTVRIRQGELDNGASLLTVDCARFFDRDAIYGSVDDTERYVFFGRAAYDALAAVALRPAVVHGFEWESAAALALVARASPGAATVLSLAKDAVHHLAAAEVCRWAGLDVDAQDGLDLLALARRSARRVIERDRELTPQALDAIYREAGTATTSAWS